MSKNLLTVICFLLYALVNSFGIYFIAEGDFFGFFGILSGGLFLVSAVLSILSSEMEHE
jgi:hypothetical protein